MPKMVKCYTITELQHILRFVGIFCFVFVFTRMTKLTFVISPPSWHVKKTRKHLSRHIKKARIPLLQHMKSA